MKIIEISPFDTDAAASRKRRNECLKAAVDQVGSLSQMLTRALKATERHVSADPNDETAAWVLEQTDADDAVELRLSGTAQMGFELANTLNEVCKQASSTMNSMMQARREVERETR